MVNLVNGSTLFGLGVARLGSARLARCPDGLLAGTGYQLPVPVAPAFTLGNVIITRRPTLDVDSNLFRHEARHATQYAWSGGLLMLPLFFAGAGASWLLSSDFGARNPFERTSRPNRRRLHPRPLRHLTRPPRPPPSPRCRCRCRACVPSPLTRPPGNKTPLARPYRRHISPANPARLYHCARTSARTHTHRHVNPLNPNHLIRSRKAAPLSRPPDGTSP